MNRKTFLKTGLASAIVGLITPKITANTKNKIKKKKIFSPYDLKPKENNIRQQVLFILPNNQSILIDHKHFEIESVNNWPILNKN